MKNKIWILEFKKPLSHYSNVWHSFASDIIQALEFCNLRNDDINNVNQICINIQEDCFKEQMKDGRKRLNSIIKIEGNQINIYEQSKEKDRLYLTIKHNE